MSSSHYDMSHSPFFPSVAAVGCHTMWCQDVSFSLNCELYHPLLRAEKAVAYMESADQIDLQDPVESKLVTCQSLSHYVNTINSSPRNIGKDGKFQLLVCLGARLVHQSLCCIHNWDFTAKILRFKSKVCTASKI